VARGIGAEAGRGSVFGERAAAVVATGRAGGGRAAGGRVARGGGRYLVGPGGGPGGLRPCRRADTGHRGGGCARRAEHRRGRPGRRPPTAGGGRLGGGDLRLDRAPAAVGGL